MTLAIRPEQLEAIGRRTPPPSPAGDLSPRPRGGPAGLRLRADQLKSLAEVRFVTRAAAFIARHAAPSMPAADERAVRVAVARGRAAGLTGERGLTRYVYLAFLLASDEAVRGAIDAELARAGPEADAAMDALFDRLAGGGGEA